ncbi:MAG TPA: bifunctional phosphopantothenoylcysteine decarboxylase/phosphopantothenate--cysteine ligase CoaBC [Bacteroides sp.]|nr:bifunctional phosphopantothenoylcysteine decarboxylase/phosphopantothenate--cysteine ligase CoaBC [Bacteroides sp.]
MDLAGKKIILGVTGSIAVYKAVHLLRLMVREGADVQVVMTPAALQFVAPVTFSAISGKPALSEFFRAEGGDWNSHVEMGIAADLMLVAPVTATTLGKMAHGIADNLLVATYLSARCPVILAPAMDTDMYLHPSTRENVRILTGYGNHILEPAEGALASGLEGRGRMQEPEEIVRHIMEFGEASSKKKLLNKKVLVTAGPTHESIDPVRYIGNHSTGRMGYALAGAFASAGAEVILVSGPVALEIRHPGVSLIRVTSAAEMYDACREVIGEMDVAVFNAAVSDYTPAERSPSKVKRGEEEWNIRLRPTVDIAASLGNQKKEGQFFAGFALETDDEMKHAAEKLRRKNMDLIVLNSLRHEGAGFGTETNRVTTIDRAGNVIDFGLKPKQQVAADLVEHITKMIDDA